MREDRLVQRGLIRLSRSVFRLRETRVPPKFCFGKINEVDRKRSIKVTFKRLLRHRSTEEWVSDAKFNSVEKSSRS